MRDYDEDYSLMRDMESDDEDFFDHERDMEAYEKWIKEEEIDDLVERHKDNFLEEQAHNEIKPLPDLEWAKHIEEIVDDDIREQEIRSVQDLVAKGDELKDIPNVPWSTDIARIEDGVVREKEIEYAQKYAEKEQVLREKLEKGEISDLEYDLAIRRDRARASTRSGLESVGINYDDLGDMAEDYDMMISGDLEAMEAKEELQRKIDLAGEDIAEQLADMMLEDEKINRAQRDSLGRQARLHGK